MRRTFFALLASVAVFACGKSDNPRAKGAAGAPPAAAVAEADDIFKNRCSACHGPNGSGDGPGAAALNPRPRNFHDQAWQASVTDEHIQKIIKGGGQSVGKSPSMVPNPDLIEKPQVVQALKDKVRAFGAP